MTEIVKSSLLELGKTLMITFIFPLGVLALDYFIRAQDSNGEPWFSLVRTSGPDCCVLTLGASAAVLIDPRVAAAPIVGSRLFLASLMVILFAFRIACVKAAKRPYQGQTPASLRYGIWSLSLVSVVICFGYLFPVLR